MKVRLPDADIEPIWDKMTEQERHWYERFKWATERGNADTLRQLCDEAPCDRYEEMLAEVVYERSAPKRMQYTIRPERRPRYSEWDYAWSPPRRVRSVKQTIEQDYNGLQIKSGTMSWAK